MLGARVVVVGVIVVEIEEVLDSEAETVVESVVVVVVCLEETVLDTLGRIVDST